MAKQRLSIVFPDLHLGSHDSAALRVALRAAERAEPDEVIILGDWLDAHDWSAHPASDRRELRAATYGEEVESCRAVLEFLEALPSVRRVVYVEGNHEHRVERWATTQRGPWLSVVDGLLPRAALSRGRAKDFRWIPYKSPGEPSHYEAAPGLIAVHGWSTAKHAAAAHLGRAHGLSVIHGHTHRRQVHTLRHPVTGEVIEGHSSGCLAQLQPLWVNGPTAWVHGYAMIQRRGDRWSIHHVGIHDGAAILPDGSQLKAGREGSVIRGVA